MTYLQIIISNLSLVDISHLQSYSRLLNHLLFKHFSVFHSVSSNRCSVSNWSILSSWVWSSSFSTLILESSSLWLLTSNLSRSIVIKSSHLLVLVLHNQSNSVKCCKDAKSMSSQSSLIWSFVCHLMEANKIKSDY